jgi:hypothetical protein
VAAALVFGGLMSIGPLPAADAPLEEYALHFRNYHDRILAGGSVAALGLALTLCFLASLEATLRRREAGGLATLGLVAGGVRIALVYGALALLLAGAYRFGIGDAGTPRTLADGYAIALLLSAYPTMVSLAAFGVAMLRTSALPSWLGWLSIAASAAHLVGAASFTQSGPLAPAGFVGALLMPLVYYAWVLAVSVALIFARGANGPRSA